MPFSEKTLEEFARALASASPTPGGGGASALAGALAAALGNMVGSLTVGKAKYALVEPQILLLNQQAEELRTELLALIDEDAEAFEPLARAYAIPKDSPGRAEIMEAALARAAEPPLKIMRRAGETVKSLAAYAAAGSALAISDVGCGAALCVGALRAAALNVYINTKSMMDRSRAKEIEAEADRLLRDYLPMADGIYQVLTRRLRDNG